ncbi:Fc.00g114500.m01.CDS01 [Cosmosporella sp. VM-42]
MHCARWAACKAAYQYISNHLTRAPSNIFSAHSQLCRQSRLPPPGMDPLSISASIMTVIEFTRHIGSACKSYIEGVKDHPKDLRTVYVEIQTLAVIFESLRFLDQDDPEDASILAHLEGPDGAVEGCRAATEALSTLFSPPTSVSSCDNRSKRLRLQMCLDTLAWPLKVEKARRLMEDINRHKSTINVAIGGGLLRDVHAIKKSLSESQLLEVCTWFQHTDPSATHNTAQSLYEKGTCDWVLRSEQWKRWLDSQTRCFWIHGIPGAGKTVLAAHLIEEIDGIIEGKRHKLASVYYYCYHGHDQDEAVPMLRWLINQLCRQMRGIPEPVYTMFRQGRSPSRDDLLCCLSSVLEHFDKVFVTIDALDESKDRENLLSLIEKLMTDHRFLKIQLLATSRQYPDIRATMIKISDAIPMSNELVEVDIKTYVAARMICEPKFHKWPRNLRDEIEERLSRGAKGMFRWAVCQLDILRRLRSVTGIRDAIRNMPEGLDETYERIFSLIDSEDRELVRHTLHWLSCALYVGDEGMLPETPSVILGSYLFRERQKQSTKVNGCSHILDVQSLEESCGCLIKFDRYPNGKLNAKFAHYTVREFLQSERASKQHSSFFRIHAPETYMEVCDLNFHIATNITFDDVMDLNEDMGWECDHELTIRCQVFAITTIESFPELLKPELVAGFFDLSKPNRDFISDSLRRFSLDDTGGAPYTDFGIISTSDWEKFAGQRSIAMWIRMASAGFAFDFAMDFFQSLGQSVRWTENFSLRIPIPSGGKFGALTKTRSFCERNTVYEFQGNVLELFASFRGHEDYSKEGGNVLIYLLDHVPDEVDYTRILHLHMENHLHFEDGDDTETCIISILLRKGASPQPKSCQVTPLQIAVAHHDINGARLLLEARADPNSCGDIFNNEWDNDLLFHHLCHLNGKSPLFILRQLAPVLPTHDDKVADRVELETLLQQHGAREFTVSTPNGN